METVILISKQATLYQAITAVMPKHWILLYGDQFSHVLRYLEESAQQSDNRLTILVDINNLPEWAHQIISMKRDNVLVFGLINDPDQQETAFRAGANEYLLKPWLASEINGRLIRRLQEQEIIQGLVKQINQKERQASIGRLTSFICHDINNAMQASRGALDLALEETEISDEVVSYVNICRQETRRVVKLLERMRQIYRPQGNVQEFIQLGDLLQDVLTMASEELSIHNISTDGEIAIGTPTIRGVPDQLYLAFLCILFNLCDAIGSTEGSTLRYQYHNQEQVNQVEFRVAGAASTHEAGLEEADNSLLMEPARSMIIANHGDIHTGIQNREIFIRIGFPIIID